MFLITFSITSELNAQNGIIGAGFSSGWSNPGNIGNFVAGAGSSRIYTTNPGGTGNQFFRMVRNWGGNNSEFSPSASCCGGCDAAVSAFDTEIFAGNTNCTNGAWYINCPNTTDNYVFKTPDGPSGTSFVVFRVQGAVRSITSVSQAPIAASVAVSQGVAVTATPSAALSTGQAVYIRYTTNGFATSTVAQMTFSAGNYVATIPGQASGTTVNYYIFTSGVSNVATNGSNADFYSINLNNNGGSNYSYTVSNLYLSANTGNYTTGSTWLGGVVPPTNAAIQILNSHNVTLNTAATVSSITINAGGTFTASDATPRTFTISNNTSSTTLNKVGNWINGTGGSTVVFSGSATHTIAGTISLQNVQASTGLNFGTAGTITTNFQLNAGGFVSGNAPIYGIGSSLIYSTGGAYGRGLEWSNTSGAGYPNNVRVSNNSTIDLSNGGPSVARACAGNLTVDDGSTLNMNNMTANLTVNGNITLGSSGTATLTLSNQIGGDLLLGGDWNRNASSILNNNNRQVSFIGGSSQTIIGQTTFDFLRINNTGGVVLNNPITVNQQLDLSSGRITLGTNNVVMGATSSIINASTNSFIITNSTGLLLQQVAAVQKIFPVGFNSTNYTPVRLTQNGTSDQISVRVNNSVPPFTQTPNNASRMVNLEWTINEAVAGGNSLLTEFEWRNANEAGSFIRTNGVFHANWNGSAFEIRNANFAGANPYTSTSTADYTGNLSNQIFLIGNVNGILSCLSTVANGDWNTGSTWAGGIVPPIGAVVCLNHDVTATATNPAVMSSVTLSSGSSLDIGTGRTLNIANSGSIVNNTGATQNLGNGSVVFAGTAITSGQPLIINNMSVVGFVTNVSTITLLGTLTIAGAGANFSSGIDYGASSTLRYA
ncbi:MAG: hypothetical protein WED33_09940, partial [Bacteroidia bacterium]